MSTDHDDDTFSSTFKDDDTLTRRSMRAAREAARAAARAVRERPVEVKTENYEGEGRREEDKVSKLAAWVPIAALFATLLANTAGLMTYIGGIQESFLEMQRQMTGNTGLVPSMANTRERLSKLEGIVERGCK